MSKYFYITLGLILTVFVFNSCEDDIVLTGEYKETAVIYGLLDQAEPIHYIKINRAFIGPGNAIDIANIPDSNYFENVYATVSEILNNDTSRVWILDDTLLDTKDTNGIFYAPTQKVYYFTDASQGALNEAATYRLDVVINKGLSNEFSISGETELVSGLTSGQSQVSTSFGFIDNNNNLKSASVLVSGTGTAAIVNATVGVDFYEYIGTSILDSISYSFNTGEVEVTAPTLSTSIEGKYFFESIRDHCTPNTSIDKRRMKSITVTLTGGSEVLLNYINANKPSSTIAQTKPAYTNLTVTNDKNIVGIFSARQTVKIVKHFAVAGQTYSCLDQKSRKELCMGQISGVTANLFFCSDLNFDSNQTWHCP